MSLQTIIEKTKDMGIHPRLVTAFQDFLGYLQQTITASQCTRDTLQRQKLALDSFLRQRPQPPALMPLSGHDNSHSSVLDLRTARSTEQYEQNMATYVTMAQQLSDSSVTDLQSSHATVSNAREQLFASYASLLTVAEEITTQNQLTTRDLHFLQERVFPFADCYAADRTQAVQKSEEEQPCENHSMSILDE